MGSVTGQVKLNKEGIVLKGASTTLGLLREKFLKNKSSVLLSVEFRDEEKYKTYPQLGYIYNELGEKAKIGYRAMGYTVRNRNIAVNLLKQEEDIDFMDYVVDENTGEVVGKMIKSLSDAKVKEVAEFIERAIAFIMVDMRLYVTPPDEYFKGKKIRKEK